VCVRVCLLPLLPLLPLPPRVACSCCLPACLPPSVLLLAQDASSDAAFGATDDQPGGAPATRGWGQLQQWRPSRPEPPAGRAGAKEGAKEGGEDEEEGGGGYEGMSEDLREAERLLRADGGTPAAQPADDDAAAAAAAAPAQTSAPAAADAAAAAAAAADGALPSEEAAAAAAAQPSAKLHSRADSFASQVSLALTVSVHDKRQAEGQGQGGGGDAAPPSAGDTDADSMAVAGGAAAATAAAELAKGQFGALPPAVTSSSSSSSSSSSGGKAAADDATTAPGTAADQADGDAPGRRRQQRQQKGVAPIAGQQSFEGVDGKHCFFNLKVRPPDALALAPSLPLSFFSLWPDAHGPAFTLAPTPLSLSPSLFPLYLN